MDSEPRQVDADDHLSTVYDELRAIAARYMRGQSAGHTLQPTALVHEAYLKLAASPGTWQDETHFRAVAALAMRQLLLNHAEKRTAKKRGGGRRRELLTDDAVSREHALDDLLDLAEALRDLERADERKASVAELRLFAGLTMPQISSRLQRSQTTVEDDWRSARAWLAARLEGAA